MLKRFGFAVIIGFFCLIPGCSTPMPAEPPKVKGAQSKPVEAPPAATDSQAAAGKATAVYEQRLMPLEDTTTFKKLHTVAIICTPRPDVKRAPNASEPNINNDWYVRIDGKLGPRHDGIGEMAFSPDGSHIAYAAKEGSKFYLIVDGNAASQEFDNIEDIMYSPDGNHLAYGANIGDKWFAVLDGNAGPKYDFVGNFAFSPDSRRFTHAAGKQNGKKQTVVLDGVEICPPYDVTWLPVFSNDSKRMAFMANEDTFKRFMVVNGKPDEIYDTIGDPIFSPDSQHYVYFAGKGNSRFLVFDGNAGTLFEDLLKRDSLTFGPNDNRVAYRTGLEEKWFVVVDDHVGPFFDAIGDRSIVLSSDGKRHAYAAKQGDQWCVVVNNQLGPLYEGISADGPVFSPDGNHLAYGAFLGGRFFMVIDHQPVPGYDNYDGIGYNSISFSPDSRHLIYKVLRDQKWHMAVDGQLGPAYDKLPFKPTVTENAVEYLAGRDGWVFRCRRLFEEPRISKVEPKVYEQRLMPLEDTNNFQKIAYISDNLIVVSVGSQEKPDNFVLVKGGTFRNTESNYYGKSVISSFYIGRYEVTQKEWIEVMGSNPSKFKGDNLPVETVSWYDCVEYCNKRSIKEGLKPYYDIDKNKKDPNNDNDIDDIKWTVTINADANGYRLPTEAEWEYAAGGGQMSKSYTYSGSNYVDEVAWYWVNSGDKYLLGFWSWPAIEENNNKTKSVGGKESNELGLYDMSGNVREWCWDWHESNGTDDPKERVWRGGGWLGVEHCCESSFRGSFKASGNGPDQGFRVCHGK